jgi:hypothetical protein
MKPGSGASTAGLAATPSSETDLPRVPTGPDIRIDVVAPTEGGPSMTLIIVLGAAAVLGSALFWFLLS